MSEKPAREKTSSGDGGNSEPTVTPTTGRFQQLQYDMGVALNHGINSNNRLDRIEKIVESMVQSQKETNDCLKLLWNNMSELVVQLTKNQGKSESILVDGDGDVVMTSYDVPSNHIAGGDSFKGKDTDVERFVAFCRRQFKYYQSFYATEKKRVEFIEAHLGPASEWYYIFLNESQKNNPDSDVLLNELTKHYLTQAPETLTLRKLSKLTHKWGNAVDFVTKFKLYATSLKVPEVMQLQLFEERIQPLVREKLMDLEPKSRKIDTYCQMLMIYDNERDRHWTSDQLKGNKNSQNKHEWNSKKKPTTWDRKNHQVSTPTSNQKN